jgi:hypothetical protein
MQMTSWPATVKSVRFTLPSVWLAGAILFEAYYPEIVKQGDIKMRRLLSKPIEYQKGSNFVAIQKPSWITPRSGKSGYTFMQASRLSSC